MNILQNRIDSFKNNLLKWPYENDSKYPKPASFAKAGFYFVRRPKAPDSVRCFVCDIEVSHWRPNQSPFVRHGLESPHCAWKLLNFPDAHKVSLNTDYKNNGGPRSSAMRAARLATFNNHNYWPPKKGVSNYATAAKLAGAGFFFSPTATKPARVKCAYCGTTMDSPSASLDILSEHEKLNSKCVFFGQTHNTRKSNRKETMDSVGSHNTFRTAESNLKNDDDSSDDGSMLKRRIDSPNKTSTKPSSKRQKSNSEDEANTSELGPVILIEKFPASDLGSSHTKTQSTKAATSSTDVSLKKVPTSSAKTGHEKHVVSSISPSSKKTSVTQTVGNKDAPEHAFKLRRPIITFGSSRHTHRPLTKRHIAPSIDILPNLESSVVIRSSNELKQSTASKHATVLESSKSSAINERKKITQPITTRVFERRSKNRINILPSTDNVVNSVKRRSLSTTHTSDSETAGPSNKRLRLNPVVDKLNTDDQNTSPKPQQPRKDKGKGRAVEYNLPLQSSQKKPVNLSRSQGRPSTSSSEASSSSSAIFNVRPSTNAQGREKYDSMVSNRSRFNREEFFGTAPTVYTTMEALSQPSNAAASHQDFPCHSTSLFVAQPSSDVARSSSSYVAEPSTSTVNQPFTSAITQETKEIISSPPAKSIKETLSPLVGQNNKEESSFSPAQEGEQISSLPIVQDLKELSLSMVSQDTRGISVSLTPQDDEPILPSPSAPVTMDTNVNSQEQVSPVQQPTYSPHLSVHISNPPSPNSPDINQDRTPSPHHNRIVYSPVREEPRSSTHEVTVNQKVLSPRAIVYSPERSYLHQRSKSFSAENFSSLNQLNEDDEEGINYEFSGLNITPIADENSQTTDIMDMEFNHSTPIDSRNVTVRGIDLFGDNPYSPIPQIAQVNEFMYTPESRTRNAIERDSEGTPRLAEYVQRNEEEGETSISVVETLAQRRQMTVEQYCLALIEDSIGKIEQERDEKISMVEERYESIRSEISKIKEEEED